MDLKAVKVLSASMKAGAESPVAREPCAASSGELWLFSRWRALASCCQTRSRPSEPPDKIKLAVLESDKTEAPWRTDSLTFSSESFHL